MSRRSIDCSRVARRSSTSTRGNQIRRKSSTFMRVLYCPNWEHALSVDFDQIGAVIARRASRDEAISPDQRSAAPDCFAVARNDAVSATSLESALADQFEDLRL